MPSVSQCHSPPPSPKSPPRKKTKFSLQRKKKTASTSDYDRDKRDKLFPLFTSPATRNASDDEVFEPPKPPPPYAGLVNHGNICYANAVLQVLRHCPGLIESVFAIDSHLTKVHPTKVHPKLVVPETNNNERVSWFIEFRSTSLNLIYLLSCTFNDSSLSFSLKMCSRNLNAK